MLTMNHGMYSVNLISCNCIFAGFRLFLTSVLAIRRISLGFVSILVFKGEIMWNKSPDKVTYKM